MTQRHEIFRRRGASNAVIGLILGGVVLLLIALTYVKLQAHGPWEGFDHVPMQGRSIPIEDAP